MQRRPDGTKHSRCVSLRHIRLVGNRDAWVAAQRMVEQPRHSWPVGPSVQRPQKQSLDQRNPDFWVSTARDSGYPSLRGWSGHRGIASAPPSGTLLPVGSRDVMVWTRCTKEKVIAAFAPSVEAWAVAVLLGTQETPRGGNLVGRKHERAHSRMIGQEPRHQSALCSWAGSWFRCPCKPSTGNITRTPRRTASAEWQREAQESARLSIISSFVLRLCFENNSLSRPFPKDAVAKWRADLGRRCGPCLRAFDVMRVRATATEFNDAKK